MNETNETGVDASVSGLDLEAIKEKIARDKEWAKETVDEGERQYKRFLNLKRLHPDESVVPTKFIDEIWHGHILDTHAYADHCQLVFGYFVDHYPYLGVGGDDAAAQLNAAFDRTAQLWVNAYDEDYRALPIPADARATTWSSVDGVGLASRCGAGHSCHAPSNCACRSPGACK